MIKVKTRTIHPTMNLLSICFNFAFIITLLIAYFVFSAVAFVVMIIMHFILIPIPHTRHKFIIKIKHLWLSLTTSILGLYFVHPIYICYNKKIFDRKKVITISNHLTNFDWIYTLVVLNELGMYENLVIILKESLRKIPIFGYGMKIFGYIFLKRQWSEDYQILLEGLKKIKEKENFNLLLFPEGTIINKEAHEKSKKYCETNNIKIGNEPFNPETLLLPRKTGFDMIYRYLNEDIEGFVNITLFINPYIEYPSDKFDLWDVFIRWSKKINFCFLIDYIENNEEAKSKDWLYKVFKKKDELIKNYIPKAKKFKNKNEFKEVILSLIEENRDYYFFRKTYIRSKNSLFYYLGFFSLIIYLIIFILSKN